MSKRTRDRGKSSRGVDRPRTKPAPAQSLRSYCLGAAAALMVATPLIPGESAAQFGTGAVLVMLWLVLLTVWLAIGLLQPRFEIRLGWTGAAIGVLLLLHSISTMAVVVTGQGSPRPALNMMWQWISFGVTFFLVRQLVRSQAECRAVCAVMIGLAVALSMYGYFQYAYSLPMKRAAYAADPDRVALEDGIDAPAGTPIRRQYESRVMSTEPIATFALTNSLAGYLAPWLVAALGIGLAAWRDERLRMKTLAAVACGVMLIAGCLLLTKSRTALLATSGGVLLLAMYGRSRGWRLDWRIPAAGVAAAVLLLVFVVVSGGLDAQMLSEAPKSVLYRVQYWQASAAMIADYPLFGCGPGNFQETYTAYKLPEASETVADPHNFLFEVWATAGTPALAALLAVFACFGWQVSRTTALRGRRSSDEATASEGRRTSEDEREQDERKDTSAAAVHFVYVGALVGFVVAEVCGWLVGMEREEFDNVSLLGVTLPAIWLLGVPVAAACVAMLHGWVERGSAALAGLLAALAVLLVNLLAAGGIGFPGVSQSVWVLMALALVAAEVRRPWNTLARAPAVAALMMALMLSLACYVTFYNPVLSVRGATMAAFNDWSFDQFEAHYRSTARVDPYSPLPWRQLAQLSLSRWCSSRQPEHFETFEQMVEELSRREPRSSKTRSEIGGWYLAAFRDSGDPRLAAKAAEWYRDAVRLYPNGNMVRAQLAWVLALAGEKEAAAREAAEALRLDALNPHVEQKLAEQQVYDPPPIGRPPANAPPHPDTPNAEQLMHRLRTAEQGRAGGA